MVSLAQSFFSLKKHLLFAIVMLGGLCFLVIQLRLGNDHIQRIPPSVTSTTKTLSAEKIVAERLSKSLNHLAAIPVHDGDILKAENISRYTDAIFLRREAKIDTFQCPLINETRYADLTKSPGPTNPKLRYFFALNLRENLGLLPRLIGSIVEAIQFLGPEYCALSIIEGNSDDGTADVLNAIRPHLESLGIRFYLDGSLIDPKKTERIQALADLRNLALKPLVVNSAEASKDTTIIFLNDVAACADSILELVLQRRNLGADLVCGMDWNLETPRFYDIWIARTIKGDDFIDVPDGKWAEITDLFWNDDYAMSRYTAFRPFQVFSCWNGGAVFGAQSTLEGLRFRAAKQGECYQGEPQIFCKEMWYKGFGKIAVVPSVNYEYTIEAGKRINKWKGFVSDIVSQQDPADDKFEWQLTPPAQVKCIGGWGNTTWGPWDEALP